MKLDKESVKNFSKKNLNSLPCIGYNLIYGFIFRRSVVNLFPALSDAYYLTEVPGERNFGWDFRALYPLKLLVLLCISISPHLPHSPHSPPFFSLTPEVPHTIVLSYPLSLRHIWLTWHSTSFSGSHISIDSGLLGTLTKPFLR